MKIEFVSSKQPNEAPQAPVTRVYPVFGNRRPGVKVSQSNAGSVLSYIGQLGVEFSGKTGEVQDTSPPYAKHHDVFLGLGKADKVTAEAVQKAGKALYAKLGTADVTINVDRTSDTALDEATIAANLADALLSKSYSFTKYKTGKVPEKKAEAVKPQTVKIVVDDPAAAEAAFAPLRAVTEASFWASDLANRACNDLYPESYAGEILGTLNPLGVSVTTLGPGMIRHLDMGGVWNVGKGSEKGPRVVVMEYDGTQGRQKNPLVLVGKGVTMDTGGISIKPGAGMDDMKYDMGGSAMMVGAIRAAAARKAPVHIVGIVGLVENMPSHNAYKPGDIITMMSGITVHIGNTDAEGRLVLGDALHLAQHLEVLEKITEPPKSISAEKPRAIFDAATLTGAEVVALGDERAAVFSTDDSLTAAFKRAGEATGEKCWPMPLGQEYADSMRHRHADLNNMSTGSKAGSSTAAEFLHFFIEKNEDGADKYPWVHIDMAGPGIKHPGWGVRVLDRVIRDHYEEKPQGPVPDFSPLV